MGNGLRTQARRVLLRQVAPAYHQASGSQKQQSWKNLWAPPGTHANMPGGCSIISRRSLRHRQRFADSMDRRSKRRWCWFGRRSTGCVPNASSPSCQIFLKPWRRKGMYNSAGTPQPAPLDERSYRRSPLASPSLHPSPRPFDHQSGSPAQAADSDPHLRQMGRGQTGLSGGRSGRPLWWASAGRLPLHDHADRYRHRVDGMFPFTQPWARGGAGRPSACPCLFPFPILGIDTDNGGEFINEEVAAYCVREQITFTRGRPYEKRDQCNVAEKWGGRATGGRWAMVA